LYLTSILIKGRVPDVGIEIILGARDQLAPIAATFGVKVFESILFAPNQGVVLVKIDAHVLAVEPPEVVEE
jgi:hypothetical protein